MSILPRLATYFLSVLKVQFAVIIGQFAVNIVAEKRWALSPPPSPSPNNLAVFPPPRGCSTRWEEKNGWWWLFLWWEPSATKHLLPHLHTICSQQANATLCWVWSVTSCLLELYVPWAGGQCWLGKGAVWCAQQHEEIYHHPQNPAYSSCCCPFSTLPA